METVQIIAQWVVGLGILNVWLLRANLPTAYRGGDAGSMVEEFKVYGLPKSFMYFVGTVKVILALALIAGTWMPQLVLPAAASLALLMAAAVLMHVKVKDTFKKTLPSIGVLLLCLLVIFA